MLQQFKEDLWLVSREAKGYYAWAENHHWKLSRTLWRRRGPCGMCMEDVEPRNLVDALFQDGLGFHPLLDIAFEAFARAESRLALRFVPQRSNEERLTGHLVSEMEAAIHLASVPFAAISKERYGEAKYIDFAYYDLSRGGHVEKDTGGDLGLILSVDLPDRPRLVSYAAIQAKKLYGSTSLDKTQYNTLTGNYQAAAMYLFYDCEFSTLAPPMIMPAIEMVRKKEEKENTESFCVDQPYVFSNGLPLSLWLITQFSTGKQAATTTDFLSAQDLFRSPANNRHIEVDPLKLSRLAMISIGKPFGITPDIEAGIRVTL